MFHAFSERIGSHQAGSQELKAAPFEAFVYEQDLWLPSTFDHCQQGPGDTWTHSSGKMRRIDFVGLPCSWPPVKCKAWVSEIVDASISRSDHLAACAEICFVSEIYARQMTGRAKTFRLQAGESRGHV